MPVTIVTGSMKYKDTNGQYQEITGLKGAPGDSSIDDAAGIGDIDKVWSADKSATEVDAVKKYAEPNKNMINPSAATNGRTDYIPVEAGTRYVLTHADQALGSFGFSLNTYDANKENEQIGFAQLPAGSFQTFLTFSSGQAYVRIAISGAPSGVDATDLSRLYLGKFSDGQTFVPYHYSIDEQIESHGYYTKPSGGIPAADIASGVIPDISVIQNEIDAIHGNIAETATVKNGLYISPSSDKFASTNNDVSVLIIPIDPSGTYFIWKNTPTTMRTAVGNIQDPENNSVVTRRKIHTTASSDPLVITASSTDHYLYIQLYVNADAEQYKNNTVNMASLVVSKIDANGLYIKPATGIPASDLASGVIPSVPVQDVQVNGTSVLSQGVANVARASATNFGVLKLADADAVKSGTDYQSVVAVARQNAYTFYGLAKAAGDSTQSSSSNSVGTYTETAQSKIHEMLDAPVTVSGTNPVINAMAGIRYICGEVSTISITPPQSGIIDVIFTSGTTPAVLTVPNTVHWPGWFDPTTLDTSTIYEINIADGVYGAVMTWT